MTSLVMPTLKMEGYVIVDPATGLFSSGGMSPKFKKRGKVWANIGHLKNHLAQFVYQYYREKEYTIVKAAEPYRKAKVYDIVSNKELFDVWEYLEELAARKTKERAEWQAEHDEWYKAKLRAELNELENKS